LNFSHFIERDNGGKLYTLCHHKWEYAGEKQKGKAKESGVKKDKREKL
jgi:hypothetical protein